MVKIIYLTCRFTVLTLWPLVVYVYVNDHSADNCSPWTYPQTLIYLVLVINSVFVPLHTFDIGWCSRLPPIVSLENSWCFVIDSFLGLLLSRTWVFTGRRKLVAWAFSLLFLGYFGSMLWASISFMELSSGTHHGKSPEACLESLEISRHRLGVGLVNSFIPSIPLNITIFQVCSSKNLSLYTGPKVTGNSSAPLAWMS